MKVPTLVIGDIHRHTDRLEALLIQEGCLDPDGSLLERRKGLDEVKIIMLGDIAHCGQESTQSEDDFAWEAALAWTDQILWGNHDRAMIDPSHEFFGYRKPDMVTVHRIRAAQHEGRVSLASDSHGWLLTHAGLSPGWLQYIPEEYTHSAKEMASWLNSIDEQPPLQPKNPTAILHSAVRDGIGHSRGGTFSEGGILWRDWREPLWMGLDQICGHTSDDQVRRREDSWCLDIGNASNGRLAGIWLPEQRVVEIDLGFSMP